MPQVSIIIPVIIAGLAVGSAIRSKSPRISKKRLASASLVAGILNGAYAYLQDLFFPSQTFPRGTNTAFTAFTRATSSLPSTSSEVFVINSLLSGFLIVLAVLGIAMLYARVRKGEELEEMPELPIEEESKLTAS